MSMISSKIVEIGELAISEEYPILILFNTTAPAEFKEISVIHEFKDTPQKEMLKKGSKIMFGNTTYTVEDIGYVANQTLYDLGHISLYFGLEEGTNILPGSAVLTPYKLPEVKVGDTIRFIK
jgi:glucitol/sorbitol PTS system EIIA component